MRKTFTLLFLLLIACGTSFAETKEVAADEIKSSGCLDLSRSSDNEDLKWHITYNDGVLTLEWLNVVANCCPVDFKSGVINPGDATLTFSFSEVTEFGGCDCLCPYNVTSTFSGIAAGKYVVSFTYLSNTYSAEVEISEACDITIKADEAALKSVAADSGLLRVSGGLLLVNSDENVVVEIFDASACLVGRAKLNSNTPLSLAGFGRGVYIARAGNQTLRFIR